MLIIGGLLFLTPIVTTGGMLLHSDIGRSANPPPWKLILESVCAVTAHALHTVVAALVLKASWPDAAKDEDALLPGKFRSALYLDVFGWLLNPSGAGGSQAQQRPDEGEDEEDDMRSEFTAGAAGGPSGSGDSADFATADGTAASSSRTKMGFLEEATPMPWAESVEHREHVKAHGIEQFLVILHDHAERRDTEMLWGDEQEYILVEVGPEPQDVRLLLRAHAALPALRERALAYEAGNPSRCAGWTPEMGNHMIEGVTQPPYQGGLDELLRVEESLTFRRRELASVAAGLATTAGWKPVVWTFAAFPLMGTPGGQAPAEPPTPSRADGLGSRSRFVPDEVITPHPRFLTFVANIRMRKGAKAACLIPLAAHADGTPTPEALAQLSPRIPWDIAERAAAEGEVDDPVPGHIYLDASAFGAGCCCTQATFLCPSLSDARYLYDQLLVLAPLFLSLTASTPFWRGKVAATDTRFEAFAQTWDERTEAETASRAPRSSRAATSPQVFLADSGSLDSREAELNDVEAAVHEPSMARLLAAGVDARLARHVAHLFVRDPLNVFRERLHPDDAEQGDFWEQIQSSNWGTVRFKPPPARSSNPGGRIGWRVELRTPEAQPTDFENAAVVCVARVLATLILQEGWDLYIPISKVEENLTRSSGVAAVTRQLFHFRADFLGIEGSSVAKELSLKDIFFGEQGKGLQNRIGLQTSLVYTKVGGMAHLKVETLSLPKRNVSDKLSDVAGRAVFEVIYQLGVAECLQNHGCARNPHVRVSGASGGALTATCLMYGSDPKVLRDALIESAGTVHSNVGHALSLRTFLMHAMQKVICDGSYKHPAFVSQRIEIAVSATESRLPGFFTKIMLTGKERRLKEFTDSADIAIALLASSTCGLSGLPFAYQDEDGKKMTLADGAFKNFLPVIDTLSVKVKPFCDGIDLLSLTGSRADVGPTEYVPGSLGAYPPPATMLHHLYEMGYQDMEAWIETHLDEHIAKLKVSMEKDGVTAPTLPRTEFECANDGMLWYDEVMKRVPVQWGDMQKGSEFLTAQKPAEILQEGKLELQTLHFYGRGTDGKAVLKHSIDGAGVSRCFVLTSTDLKWKEEGDRTVVAGPAADKEPDVEWMIRGLKIAGALGASDQKLFQRSKTGRVQLSWIQEILLDPAVENCLHVKTANYCVTLKAASRQEAASWHDAMKKAVGELRSSFLDAGEGPATPQNEPKAEGS
ncbi:unnamed protein product [Polarella glacialis]|uniref:glutamate--cysteine ligase n=1 Tax=Polarella glacialis TaxID=89957 RepID=A0A813HDB5_POLGL|nr:unnamed protein product [Polarella glacialis]